MRDVCDLFWELWQWKMGHRIRLFADGGDWVILGWREVCWSLKRGRCEWKRGRGDGLSCRICDWVL